MSNYLAPNDCHPDLQDERLALLASLFARVCSEVFILHDSSAGDDSWSLGCRRNARWRHRLAKQAQSGDWPWFKVIKSGKRFIFSIGEVPVRFYRGRYSRPTTNTLAYDAPELNQLVIAYEGVESNYRNLYYRFAIETGLLGEPTSIVFAGLAREHGSVVCHWRLPFSTVELDEIALAHSISNEMFEIQAPVVGILKSVDPSKSNDASVVGIYKAVNPSKPNDAS